MKRFETLGYAIGTSCEKQTLEMIYEDMPQRNFSSDLLQGVPERVGVIEMQDVMWSDWGHPTRILETLRAIAASKAAIRNMTCLLLIIISSPLIEFP